MATFTMNVVTSIRTWDDSSVELYKITDEHGHTVCTTDSRSMALDFLANPASYVDVIGPYLGLTVEENAYDQGWYDDPADWDMDELPEDLEPWEPSVEEYDRQRTLEERERAFQEERAEHKARKFALQQLVVEDDKYAEWLASYNERAAGKSALEYADEDNIPF